MRTLRFLTILFLCIVTSISVSAQRGILKQANKYFAAEKYGEALKLYNQYKKVSKDEDALYKRGVSNYYTNNLDEAINDLTQAYSIGTDNKKVYLYVGKAMHSKHDFANAVKFYKNYLRYVDDSNEKQELIDDIKRCATGINMQYSDQLAFIENLGPSVNSEYDETNPVQSPSNLNKYYFSANRDDSHGGLRNSKGLKDEIYGKYSSDMYAVELNDGNWTSVNAFHPLLNSAKDDIIQDFSPDGSVMYYLKTLDGNTGELFTDTFTVNREEGALPKKLRTPAIAKLGDKDVKVFNDNTILFSSKRAGGYGGYDLYVARRTNGAWGNPQNLGRQINSAYDDVSPYISKSGRKLYFSSDRLTSMGGFDVFEATYLTESGEWSTVKNMGQPINSGQDDMHFSLSSDGTVGLISSDRAESIGGFDLFLAYMKDQVTDQLIYTDALPFVKSEERIAIEDSLATNPVVTTSTSTSTTTTKPVVKDREYYNTPLYYGADENIITPQNISKLDRIYDILVIFPETNIQLTCHSMQEGLTEFDLYFSIKRAEKAADYLIKKGVSPDRIYLRGLGANYPAAQMVVNGRTSRLAEKNNRRVEVDFFNIENTNLKVVEDPPVIAEQFRDKKGSDYTKKTEGIFYKVQIGTVKQMFKGDILKQYPESSIEKQAGDDTYTYFLGLFEKYSYARIFKNRVIREGVSDATTQTYLNGKQLSRSEIEMLQEEYSDLKEYLKYEE